MYDIILKTIETALLGLFLASMSFLALTVAKAQLADNPVCNMLLVGVIQ